VLGYLVGKWYGNKDSYRGVSVSEEAGAYAGTSIVGEAGTFAGTSLIIEAGE